MNFVQFKNVVLFATCFISLSACDVDSLPDQEQAINPEQQLLTGLDSDPTIGGQSVGVGANEGVVQPPALAPDQMQSDQEDAIIAEASILEDPAPDPALEPAPEPAIAVEPIPEPLPEPAPESDSGTESHYKPQVLVTWQLQLQGSPNTTYDADLFVVDLFDTPIAKIAALQSQGIAVICYFSAGTYEEWRSDASQFTASDLGKNLDDWPGERWLDIRSQNVRSIMTTRLDIARTKGCNGVDPDNVDGYSNPTGMDLSSGDQLSFNRFLANQAHSRGLAIGLKNNVGQVAALVDSYDFAINESCDRYNECNQLDVFITQGKPVLHVEYRPDLLDKPAAFGAYCQEFVDKQFSSLVLPRALDDEYRLSCQ